MSKLELLGVFAVTVATSSSDQKGRLQGEPKEWAVNLTYFGLEFGLGIALNLPDAARQLYRHIQ